MPVTLTPSSARHGVWQVSINGKVVVSFSGPLARERALRRVRELADLLSDAALEVDAEDIGELAEFTTSA